MDVYKIIICAVVISVLCVYLKSINSEFFTLALLAGGSILLIFSVDYIIQVTDFFKQFIELTNIDDSVFRLVFKITIIAYLIEFAATSIEDMGMKGLADKTVFIGKFILLGMSLPIFLSLMQIIINFIK